MKGRFVRTLIASGVLALAWVVLVAAQAAPPKQATVPAVPAPQAPAAPADGPATLVGSETCLGCHDDSIKGFEQSLHGKAANPRAPAGAQGCESCHGPGSRHLEDPSDDTSIRKFSRMSPRDVGTTCLTCHTRAAHAAWPGSTHDARNLSCTTCHSVHQPKSATAQLKAATETQLCATCHRVPAAKTLRASHMPLAEGKMACSTCHNPHGSTNVRLLRAGNWINESCVSCHTEKRGPFLFEHAAGRESCVTCHDPHGSQQRPDAGGEATDAVPAVPHRHQASVDDLRQPVDPEPQRAQRGRRLHHLSLADPWLQPSVRPDVHKVGMRTTQLGLYGAFILAIAVSASAQDALPSPRPAPGPAPEPAANVAAGEAEFGGRISGIAGDSARFQRYRDLRDGPTLDRGRYGRTTPAWEVHAALEHAGYRDQRYIAAFNRYGRVKVSVEWDQVPLFYSRDTRTPYTSSSPGVFLLNDTLPGGDPKRACHAGGVRARSAAVRAPLAEEYPDGTARLRRHTTIGPACRVREHEPNGCAGDGRVVRPEQCGGARRPDRSTDQRPERGGRMVQRTRAGPPRV